MAKKGLSRREREKLRHRALILEAALELFAEKGYHNVSINEIASKSEFATGTLYKFFAGKEEIYEAIILGTARSVVERLTQAVSLEDDVGAAIKAYIRAGVLLTPETLPVVRLLIAESEGLAGPRVDGVAKRVREQIDKLEAAVVQLMSRGIREGVLREGDPVFLAIALEGLVKSYLVRRFFERGDMLDESDVKRLYELFMKGASV